jgi:hypothetical protein
MEAGGRLENSERGWGEGTGPAQKFRNLRYSKSLKYAKLFKSNLSFKKIIIKSEKIRDTHLFLVLQDTNFEM